MVTPSSISKTFTIGVTIHNVAPKLKKVVMPGLFVPGVPMPFSFTVQDPGIDDNDGVLIDWDNTVLPVGPNGRVAGTHIFSKKDIADQEEDVLITVADKDGGAAHVRRTVVLQSALVTDATLKSLGMPDELLVGGTSGNNRVKLSAIPEAPPGQVGIDVYIDGSTRARLFVSKNTPINVALGAGNDRLEVTPSIFNQILANGGDGNDTLGGGSGNDILNGGNGTDKYLKSPGKDKTKS
jgi:hypothetical protein